MDLWAEEHQHLIFVQDITALVRVICLYFLQNVHSILSKDCFDANVTIRISSLGTFFGVFPVLLSFTVDLVQVFTSTASDRCHNFFVQVFIRHWVLGNLVLASCRTEAMIDLIRIISIVWSELICLGTLRLLSHFLIENALRNTWGKIWQFLGQKCVL